MLPLPSTARISPPGRKMFTTTVGYLGREGKAPLNAPTAWPTNASGFAHTGKQILGSLLVPQVFLTKNGRTEFLIFPLPPPFFFLSSFFLSFFSFQTMTPTPSPSLFFPRSYPDIKRKQAVLYSQSGDIEIMSFIV